MSLDMDMCRLLSMIVPYLFVVFVKYTRFNSINTNSRIERRVLLTQRTNYDVSRPCTRFQILGHVGE